MSDERRIGVLVVTGSGTRAPVAIAGLPRSSRRFEARFVSCLAEALAVVGGGRFDVVVLDLGPPDAVGLDGVAAVRNAAPTSVIVVLADVAHESVAVQALSCGADDYLLSGQGDHAGELAFLIVDAVARRAAEHAQRRLAALADLAGVGVLECGPDGSGTVVNERWRRLAGLDGDPVVGEDWQRLIDGRDRERMRAAWRAMLQGHPLGCEFRFVHDDGSVRWVAVAGGRLSDDERAAAGYLVTATDITAVKEAERWASDSRARLEALFEHVPAGLVLRDVEGRYELLNDVASRALGGAPEELVGQVAYGLLPAEASDRVRAEDQALLASGEAATSELSMPMGDGTTRDFRVVSYPVKDAQGNVTGIGSVQLDITDLRDAERRLQATECTMRESQTRMQALLDHAPMSVLLSDRDGRYVVVNRLSADQIGRPVEDILGRTPADLYERVRGAEIEESERQVREGGVPITFETAAALPDGGSDDQREYLVTNYPVTDAEGQVTGVGTLALDITKRKRAEASAARMAQIIKSTDAAVVGMALDGQILTWNPASERIYGYTAEEAIGRNISFLIPPERHGEVAANKTRINSGGVVGEIETVRRRKDGTEIDVAIALSPLLDASGAVVGASTIARDITAQKAMREELRASEERFRATIDHAPIGIALLTASGQPLRVNRALCEMFGYRESDLLARNLREITHHDDVDADAELIRRMLAGEIPGYEIEKRYIRADNSILFGQLSVSLVRDQAGEPVHVVSQIQDITRRKEDEARLVMHTREQEALTAVATLVASEAQPRVVFAAAAERIAGMLEADFATVVRLEPVGSARIVGGWSARHLPRAPLGALLDLDGSSATATALRTGHTAVVSVDCAASATETFPARRALAEPIEVNGQLWGAVSVGWEREPASDPDAAARLAQFAHLVSLAVTGAEAREQLSTLASTDHLTGLYNRRAFTNRVEQEVARARRHSRPLSLLVFDLDYFKLVNDTHGHQIGDRVLAEFAGETKLRAVRHVLQDEPDDALMHHADFNRGICKLAS
ncbi:MAG: PAS domain S-box protein, partial [Solirubrobacteraceae bacterium]